MNGDLLTLGDILHMPFFTNHNELFVRRNGDYQSEDLEALLNEG